MKQGWGKIPFEDSIVKVKYTTKIPSNDYLEQGLYPIVSQEEGLISGYWDNANDVFKVSSPVVIFGDHTRILKYVDFDFVLGADGVKILQPIKSIDAKFFKLYLESCKIPSLGYSRHYKLLKELHVPVPPREEQERIVEELDCLSGVIEKKREQLRELDALAQSIFYEMFGDPITNEKGWEVKKLGEVAYIGLGFTHTPEYVEDGVAFLSVKDISSGEICWDNIKYVSQQEYDSAPKGAKPNKGDIMFCRVGTMGKPVIVDTDIPFCTFVSLGYLHILDEGILNIYVKYWMQSYAFDVQVEENVKGVAIKNLNTGWLKTFNIQHPPISLQQEFADKIEAIEKQKELIKQSITQTEELFNSRMDYYFN